MPGTPILQLRINDRLHELAAQGLRMKFLSPTWCTLMFDDVSSQWRGSKDVSIENLAQYVNTIEDPRCRLAKSSTTSD